MSRSGSLIAIRVWQGVIRARESVEAALALDDELDQLARTRGVIKGKLFQSLLEALRAEGAAHAQLDNSVKHLGGIADATAFGLNLAQWASLTMRADALRNLVRIKVADDNDLRTARLGLVLCAEFFRALGRLAELRAAPELEVLQSLAISA